jgi:TolB-like protein/tRNA A-37 threonylcarbamoyl transferase component Bud32/Flp pilus assembly protein TadD
MIGQTFAHYRILERLGAGGMGVVYRAHDEQLDCDVAIKVLPAASFRDPAARARLLREARTASKLNHPHICTIYEVGEADGQAYIAMELVEGQSLSARLAGGALPLEQVLRYGLQLADAVAHAHQRGIIHRDLKSANVIITPEGRAKVLDFGLAKRLGREELTEATTQTMDSLTGPGTVVGTLAYMAPEQLRGQPADARSDVWALGVVLCEMAAGQRPFQGQTGFELSSAILSQPPAPLPPGPGGAPPTELRAVIERCLEKEPAQRYQRSEEVRAALEAVQSGAPLPVWPAWKYALSRRRWLALAAALVAVVAVVAALDVGGLRGRLLGGGRTLKFDSLAVLPFENLSGDPDQGYLADGIHEALITDLAKLSSLRRVIARSSAMRYQKTEKPLAQVARELGVDAVITGSVLRSGSRVRVTAHLINAGTEEHLWSDSYERELRDVLSLQNEIVAAITRKTKLQLTPQEQTRLASARPVNPEAYEAYLKGKFYLNRFTPEGFQKGLAYLQQAIEKDPANPLPYAGLALGYSLIGHEAAPDALTRGKAAAIKALELDDTLAEAHEALAEIKLYQDWDWAGAEQEFRRALALNPSLPEAHTHYGWYLQLFGRIDEGLAEEKRAREVDPLTPIYTAWLAWQYWEAGRHEEAIKEAQKSLELNPDFPWGLYVLGGVYAQKGMYAEAIAAHQKAAAVRPALRWALGVTYALAGRGDEARKLAAELKKKVTPMDAWGLAEVYAALGENDEAFRWLEAAYISRFSFIPWISRHRPLEPLRSDSRFPDQLRRMNLPVR